MFSAQPNNTLITGGTFTTVGGDYHAHTHYIATKEEKVIEVLRGHIAPGAFHNSAERYDPPKCHPQTRQVVLKEIMDWAKDEKKPHSFLWLYGPAGSGKSSIAQTISEMCEEEGILAGDFFFSRTAVGRNDERHLIPTLAYQLTISMPDILKFIALALDRDPLIFSRSLQAQLETLIVGPLMNLRQGSKSRPGFIIIDGLDECGLPKSQHYILTVLSSAMRLSSIPLFFLIASRPEQEIRNGFNEDAMNSLTRRLVLDDKYAPDSDIKIFLQSRFDGIKKQHPSRTFIPSPWPSESDLEALVRKSSGQFVYASTVMKFVESLRHWPTDRLNIVLGLESPGNNMPFADLDALYLHILASVENITSVLNTLSFILFIDLPQRRPGKTADTTNTANRIHVTEDFLCFRRGELQIILCDLHSVVDVPPLHDGSRNLRLFHASLGDFLLDKSRSGNFFIDSGKAHALLTEHCIKHITSSSLLSPSSSARLLRFISFTGLMKHCIKSDPTKDLVRSLYQFDFEAFLNLQLEKDHSEFLDDFLHTLPLLFEWIERQDYEKDLYQRYQAHFDRYVKSQLSLYPPGSPSNDFFAVSTLGASRTHSHSILATLTLNMNHPDASDFIHSLTSADATGLRLMQKNGMAVWAGYYSMLTDFFSDADRSGFYNVDKSRYLSLAIKLIEILAEDKDSFVNTSLRQEAEECALDCLLAILSRFPLERELATCLRERSIRASTKYTSTQRRNGGVLAVRAYLEEWNVAELLLQQCQITEDPPPSEKDDPTPPVKQAIKGRIRSWFKRK